MHLKWRRDILYWLTVAFVFLAPANARAQTIKVMISGGFSAAYKALAPQFEETAGVHVETVRASLNGTTESKRAKRANCKACSTPDRITYHERRRC